MNDFPPFVPAKPKGGVAGGIAATTPEFQTALGPAIEQRAEEINAEKKRRKRRTAAEMTAANGGEPRKRKKKQARASGIRFDCLVAFAGLSAEEIEQVVKVCEAINTFPKQARKRIAAAIGQLFS